MSSRRRRCVVDDEEVDSLTNCFSELNVRPKEEKFLSRDLMTMTLENVPGIGEKSAKKLRSNGIKSVKQLYDLYHQQGPAGFERWAFQTYKPNRNWISDTMNAFNNYCQRNRPPASRRQTCGTPDRYMNRQRSCEPFKTSPQNCYANDEYSVLQINKGSRSGKQREYYDDEEYASSERSYVRRATKQPCQEYSLATPPRELYSSRRSQHSGRSSRYDSYAVPQQQSYYNRNEEYDSYTSESEEEDDHYRQPTGRRALY